MSEQVIAAVLEGRLQAWAQSAGIPVAFEGRPFTKPTASDWLEAFLIPNETMNCEVSGQRATHIGLFQVNCWTLSGKGMGSVRNLAHQVRELFPIVPKFSSVSIEATPTQDRPIEGEAGWVAVPVLMKYRYEAI